jgi:hypothetical protein
MSRNAIRPNPPLVSSAVRLRTLSEAECYARCYGDRSSDRVSVVRLLNGPAMRRRTKGELLREVFEQRLDARGPDEEAAA